MSTGFSASPSLSRVARGNLCAGCGGCALLAPGAVTMEMTPPGYLRPRQTAAIPPAAEAAIAATCPGLGQEVRAGDRTDDALWGPYVEMRTGWSTDEALRHRAASGGALSALCLHLVETGAVDGVIATGPGMPPVANAAVLVRDAGDALEAAGSRYAPSAPLAGLGAYLDGTGRHAVVGKPCDIAALAALRDRDPRVAERFPWLLSFFCAGVPSQSGAEALLEKMGADKDAVTGFRYRGRGWPGYATATLADGTERSLTYMESWGQVLSKHVQHRCKLCADGTGTAADVACADAWEADAAGYPVFDERPGISLVVARTEAGRRLVAEAEAAGRIGTGPFDPATLAAIQPGQRGRRGALLGRLAALKLLGRPVPRYRGLRLRDAARRGGLKHTLRNALGMARRAVQGRV